MVFILNICIAHIFFPPEKICGIIQQEHCSLHGNKHNWCKTLFMLLLFLTDKFGTIWESLLWGFGFKNVTDSSEHFRGFWITGISVRTNLKAIHFFIAHIRCLKYATHLYQVGHSGTWWLKAYYKLHWFIFCIK